MFHPKQKSQTIGDHVTDVKSVALHIIFKFFCCFTETAFCYVVYAGFELTMLPTLALSSQWSCLNLPNAGIRGSYHHAQLNFRIFEQNGNVEIKKNWIKKPPLNPPKKASRVGDLAHWHKHLSGKVWVHEFDPSTKKKRKKKTLAKQN